MIKISYIHTIEADNYCFILNTIVPTEKKDGSTGEKVIQTFHPSIADACASALRKHPELRNSEDLEQAIAKMQRISRQMTDAVKHYSQDIQVIKVLSKKEKGEKNDHDANWISN